MTFAYSGNSISLYRATSGNGKIHPVRWRDWCDFCSGLLHSVEVGDIADDLEATCTSETLAITPISTQHNNPKMELSSKISKVTRLAVNVLIGMDRKDICLCRCLCFVIVIPSISKPPILTCSWNWTSVLATKKVNLFLNPH